MHYVPVTNEERAANGDELVSLFICHAVEAGATLTAADRAELGRVMVEAYSAQPVTEACVAMVIGEVVADLYHYADGLIGPARMLGAALMELSATVNTLPLLCGIGDDGRPGILACALAAVLAYGEAVEACPEGITDEAYMHWSDEVEEVRFMEARAQRHGA